VAPGAYDALSARLIEQAGFDVVYMTGFGSTPHSSAARTWAAHGHGDGRQRAGSRPPSIYR
jgi:2-methylisocitrate lyase-like PEP mutase family enzyme